MLDASMITAEQIATSLLAIPAFLPVTFCPGYVVAWATNLHDFRNRSLVERIFWSVPLSLSVSTIIAVLVGKFVSLNAVSFFFLLCAGIFLVMFVREWSQLRQAGSKWIVGWQPMGGKGLLFAIAWIAIAVFSLVDLQGDHKLFMSVTIFDHSARVDWTESILNTGVPPANPLYMYKQPAAMRYYYFWNVVCAAVAQMTHLPVRGVFVASCVWAGFGLAAIIGLYLKHFLLAGQRLRRQFLDASLLLLVTGLDICAVLWNLFYLHRKVPVDLEWWSTNQVASWLDSLLWVPHHVASMVCCMFAFLLAWIYREQSFGKRFAAALLIAAALASAFGLSIYVTFAFFLVMLMWALWQVSIERQFHGVVLLAVGGASALILLVPYLKELTHTSSRMKGGSVFEFAVREMISPDGVMAWPAFRTLAGSHPHLAQNLANLILLAPGYAIELGFYLVVLIIFLVPRWRGEGELSAAQRSLAFIAVVTLLPISLIRSSVLAGNDFGWRGALILQFPLLLLGSELVAGWRAKRKNGNGSQTDGDSVSCNPRWLRTTAYIALAIGVLSSTCQAALLRTAVPLVDPTLSHWAYISSVGYSTLDSSIPHAAVVQFNPYHPRNFWINVDLAGINHQAVIDSDQPWCGSELGGDPSGCSEMATAVDAVFNGVSGDKARAICRNYGIQYLVARQSDPAWKDKSGWVWVLRPVVSQEEFRALDCR